MKKSLRIANLIAYGAIISVLSYYFENWMDVLIVAVSIGVLLGTIWGSISQLFKISQTNMDKDAPAHKMEAASDDAADDSVSKDNRSTSAF